MRRFRESVSQSVRQGQPPVGVALGVVAVALLLVSVSCVRGDEARIRRQLEDMAETVSIEGRETPMIRQARATRLGTYLTADVDVDLGAPFSPVAGRDAVARAAAQVRVPAGGMTVEFDEVQVTVDGEARHAVASTRASVRAGTAVGGDLLETRELDLELSEIDGVWLIAQVRVVAIR